MSAILSDRINIISLDDMEEAGQIDTRLRTLMICSEGTIPGTRNFGLKGDFLDAPVNAIASEMLQELQGKVDIYIPEISIESADVSYGLDGKITTTISIQRSDAS